MDFLTKAAGNHLHVVLPGSELSHLAQLLSSNGVAVTLVEPDPHDFKRLSDGIRRSGLPIALSRNLKEAAAVDVILMPAGHSTSPGAPTISLDWLGQVRPALHIARSVSGGMLVECIGAEPLGVAERLARSSGAPLIQMPAGSPPISQLILARLHTVVEHLALSGAPPFEVDETLMMTGFAIGPFEAMDQIGVDTSLQDRRAVLRLVKDTDAEHPLMARAVAEGRLGRKVGVGWYRYPGNGGKVEDPLIEDMASEEARFAGHAQTFPNAEFITGCVESALNEAAHEAIVLGANPQDVRLVLSEVVGWTSGDITA